MFMFYSLCMFRHQVHAGLLCCSNANKQKLILEEIQATLTKAFIQHAHLDNVVMECVSTIACLAEVGKKVK